MTREIVLDTETTGIDPKKGHRIIEIGALEMINHMPTGEQLHLYINPEREIEPDAVAIHGITSEFLADKPLFAAIAEEFIAFVGGSPMVIHNAPFDMGFINAELALLEHDSLPMSQAIDTLVMARKKFPGAQANLNALCRRFEIDNSHRALHGALVDADLLAMVYVELLGGRQPDLSLEPVAAKPGPSADGDQGDAGFALRGDSNAFDRPHSASDDERAAHAGLVARIDNAIWTRG